MSAIVTYNGLAPWVNDTPFVSVSKEPLYSGSFKSAEIHSITLDGTITSDTLVQAVAGGVAPGRIYAGTTGAGGVQNTIEDVKTDILNLFSSSWGTLLVMDVSGNQIIGPANPLNNGENILVESVDFESSKWIGAVNYSIQLKSYPITYFDDLGVIEKTDEYSITQNEDETYAVTHRIQAKGVNTNTGGATNALDNAVNFVNNRRGYLLSSSLLPVVSPILLSESENIDRLSASYEVQETWIEDAYGIPQSVAGAGVHIRASVDIDQSLYDSEFTEATISVVYKGGVNTTYASLRNEVLSDADLLRHCQEVFDPTGVNVLGNMPIGGISIEESMADKQISQRATFDTNNLFTATTNNGSIFFDATYSLTYDNISGITKAVAEGNIKTRGPANFREFSLNDFLTNTDVASVLYNDANAIYGDASYKNGSNWAGGGAFVLNWSPESINISKNVEKMSLKVSATFSDEDFLADFQVASYDCTVNVPIFMRKSNASAHYNGHYSLSDFGIYNRQKHTTKIELIYKENRKSPPSQSPPFSLPGNYTAATNLMKGTAWGLAWDLDNLFPESLIPDSFIINESGNVGTSNVQSYTATRQRNYCTNNPLIGFPPDPMVGFGVPLGLSVGLNNGLLPCPIVTTAPPITTAPPTTQPPITTTTVSPTTVPPTGGTTTAMPWCPALEEWAATGTNGSGNPIASHAYGSQVCLSGQCYTCHNLCPSGPIGVLIPCPCDYSPPGGGWSYYCPDVVNFPSGGGNARDCCCPGQGGCVNV